MPKTDGHRLNRGLQHRTMAAAAADELRRRIKSGELQEGTALKQEALAEEFGISRIPLREALSQLDAEGFVTIVPHRGASVAKISVTELEELFELRDLIEPGLLRRSAPRLGTGDYAELDSILSANAARRQAGRTSQWGDLNSTFHMILYRHAERPHSLAIASNLLADTERHTRLKLALGDGDAIAQAEHAEIVSLCKAGDYEAAVVKLTYHINNTRRILTAALSPLHTLS